MGREILKSIIGIVFGAIISGIFTTSDYYGDLRADRAEAEDRRAELQGQLGLAEQRAAEMEARLDRFGRYNDTLLAAIVSWSASYEELERRHKLATSVDGIWIEPGFDFGTVRTEILGVSSGFRLLITGPQEYTTVAIERISKEGPVFNIGNCLHFDRFSKHNKMLNSGNSFLLPTGEEFSGHFSDDCCKYGLNCGEEIGQVFTVRTLEVDTLEYTVTLEYKLELDK